MLQAVVKPTAVRASNSNLPLLSKSTPLTNNNNNNKPVSHSTPNNSSPSSGHMNHHHPSVPPSSNFAAVAAAPTQNASNKITCKLYYIKQKKFF